MRLHLILKTCQRHVNVMLRHVIGHVIRCFVLLSYSHWLRKRCDLEQRIVRFRNKSHR